MPKMPLPGVRIGLSPAYIPAHLSGITIHPNQPLQFDFLIKKGDQALEGDQKKAEYKKLVKYFLASLTIPDEDQWVNLSPYEKNRIIQNNFGKTQMGRDLLAQDYLLKQITSSLMYPEEGLGKKFWDKVYERAWKEFHTTEVPVNTFNKVWIVPDQAVVYESGNTAYILKSHLKVMLEEDYLSLKEHTALAGNNKTHLVASQVIREIILPELEKEVNEDKNFAPLRQMYSGMILATWYKKTLRKSILGMVYTDKARVKGVDQDPHNNQVIYLEYLKAFKKGVYNYIKEDVDKYTNETIPRKYFAGGFDRGMATRNGFNEAMQVFDKNTPPADPDILGEIADGAMSPDDVMAIKLKPESEGNVNSPRDAAMSMGKLGNLRDVLNLSSYDMTKSYDHLKEQISTRLNAIAVNAEKIQIAKRDFFELFKAIKPPEHFIMTVEFLREHEEAWRKINNNEFGDQESAWLFRQYIILGAYVDAVRFYNSSDNESFKLSDAIQVDYVFTLNQLGKLEILGKLTGYNAAAPDKFYLDKAREESKAFLEKAEHEAKIVVGRESPQRIERYMYQDLRIGEATALKNKYILTQELAKELDKPIREQDLELLKRLKDLYEHYFFKDGRLHQLSPDEIRRNGEKALEESSKIYDFVFTQIPVHYYAGENVMRNLVYLGGEANLRKAAKMSLLVRNAAISGNPLEAWVKWALLDSLLVRLLYDRDLDSDQETKEIVKKEFLRRLSNVIEITKDNVYTNASLEHLTRWKVSSRDQHEDPKITNMLDEVVRILETAKESPDYLKGLKALPKAEGTQDLLGDIIKGFEDLKKMSTEEKRQIQAEGLIEQSTFNPSRYRTQAVFPQSASISTNGIVPNIVRNSADLRLVVGFLEWVQEDGKRLIDYDKVEDIIPILLKYIDETFGLVDPVTGKRPMEDLKSRPHKEFELISQKMLEIFGSKRSKVSDSNLMELLLTGIGDCRVANFDFDVLLQGFMKYREVMKEMANDRYILEEEEKGNPKYPEGSFKEHMKIRAKEKRQREFVLMQVQINGDIQMENGEYKRDAQGRWPLVGPKRDKLEEHTMTVELLRNKKGRVAGFTPRDAWYREDLFEFNNENINISIQGEQLERLVSGDGFLMENALNAYDENGNPVKVDVYVMPMKYSTYNGQIMSRLDETQTYLYGLEVNPPEISDFFSKEGKTFRKALKEVLLEKALMDMARNDINTFADFGNDPRSIDHFVMNVYVPEVIRKKSGLGGPQGTEADFKRQLNKVLAVVGEEYTFADEYRKAKILERIIKLPAVIANLFLDVNLNEKDAQRIVKVAIEKLVTDNVDIRFLENGQDGKPDEQGRALSREILATGAGRAFSNLFFTNKTAQRMGEIYIRNGEPTNQQEREQARANLTQDINREAYIAELTKEFRIFQRFDAREKKLRLKGLAESIRATFGHLDENTQQIIFSIFFDLQFNQNPVKDMKTASFISYLPYAVIKGIGGIEVGLDRVTFDPINKRSSGEFVQSEIDCVRLLVEAYGLHLTVHGPFLGHAIPDKGNAFQDATDVPDFVIRQLRGAQQFGFVNMVLHLAKLEEKDADGYVKFMIDAYKALDKDADGDPGIRISWENYHELDQPGRFTRAIRYCDQVERIGHQLLAKALDLNDPDAHEAKMVLKYEFSILMDSAHFNLSGDDPVISSLIVGVRMWRLGMEISNQLGFGRLYYKKINPEDHLNQNMGPITDFTGYSSDGHTRSGLRGPIHNFAFIVILYAMGYEPYVNLEQIQEITGEDFNMVKKAITLGRKLYLNKGLSKLIEASTRGDLVDYKDWEKIGYEIMEQIFLAENDGNAAIAKQKMERHLRRRLLQKIIGSAYLTKDERQDVIGHLPPGVKYIPASTTGPRNLYTMGKSVTQESDKILSILVNEEGNATAGEVKLAASGNGKSLKNGTIVGEVTALTLLGIARELHPAPSLTNLIENGGLSAVATEVLNNDEAKKITRTADLIVPEGVGVFEFSLEAFMELIYYIPEIETNLMYLQKNRLGLSTDHYKNIIKERPANGTDYRLDALGMLNYFRSLSPTPEKLAFTNAQEIGQLVDNLSGSDQEEIKNDISGKVLKGLIVNNLIDMKTLRQVLTEPGRPLPVINDSLWDVLHQRGIDLPRKRTDAAMARSQDLGGIDLNAANMDLQIKRDGQGVQVTGLNTDWAQLNNVQGFDPQIIDIRPVTGTLPILSEIESVLSRKVELETRAKQQAVSI